MDKSHEQSHRIFHQEKHEIVSQVIKFRNVSTFGAKTVSKHNILTF